MTAAPRRRATLAHVATRAGVSMATVSKVLNGRSDVAAGTRRRIAAALDELDYVPQQRSVGVFDIVFNRLESPWAIEILHGVENVLSAHGRAVAVSTVERTGPVHPASWTDAVARHRCAGVMVVMSQLTALEVRGLRQQGIPLVAIDPAGTPDRAVPSVGATNWDGGVAATEHLIDLGHRRVAAIGGPQRYLCSRARLAGYREALRSHGLPDDDRYVRWGDFRHEGGFVQGGALLDLPEPPTAIFAGSDQQALGVYEAARVRRLRVPHDLAVVGFDDLPLARWLSPPLTTVRQPLAEMGATAAEMLLRLSDGAALPARRVELSTELVVRDST